MSFRTSKLANRAIRLPWMIGGSVGTLAMIGGWWYALAAPTLATQQEVCRQLNGLNNLRAAEEGIWSRREQATSELNETEAAWKQLLDRASPHGDEAKFLRWVTEQAEATELVIRDFRPAPRQPMGEYESRPVHLTTTGQYSAICKFLDGLRTGPNLLHVVNLELTPRDAEVGLFSCSIQLNLLNRSEKAAQAKPPGAKTNE